MESGRGEPRDPEEVVLDLDPLMWRQVGDEVIVLDKRTWTYMGVNGSGALLWLKLTEGAGRAGLEACLRDTYGLAEEAAARDVGEFVELLRGHGLLADDASGKPS